MKRPGWEYGNALLFVFEGSGSRAASSYDDVTWQEPTLVIDYTTPALNNSEVPALYINEVSSSFNTHPDPSGDYVDWIEIYNPNDFDVSGEHLFLSDKADLPGKWAMSPQTIIPANGYAVIFADDQASKSIIDANFAISSKGEMLSISKKTSFGFQQIDSVTIPGLTGVPSYGRKSDGSEEWIQFGNPTPGSQNDESGIFSEAPEISQKTGKYSEAVTVQISSVYEGVNIYYTLDGTHPTIDSYKYPEPFILDKTGVVRAITVTPDRANSIPSVETYLINEQNHLPVIALTVDPRDLFSDEEGIYVKGTNGLAKNCDTEPANWNQPWQKPSHISWIGQDGRIGFSENVGIEIAGQCTRRFRQKTLEVKTKSRWGSSDIPFPLFDYRSQNSYRRFKLRGSGNDWASTMIRDGFIHNLLEADEINLEVQGYRPVELYINGIFWGLHNVRDVYSKHSIDEKFPKVEKGKIDLVKKYEIRPDNWQRRIQTGTPDAYLTLQSYLQNNSLSDIDNWEYFKTIVDFESAINYHIVQIFVGNHDWPDSNVGLWREDKDSEKWRFLLFDLDDGFGFSDTGKTEQSYNSLRDALDGESDVYPISKTSTLMFRRLMEAPEFRNEFIQRMATMMEVTFNPEYVFPAMDDTANTIAPVMERHINFWNREVENVIAEKYGERFPSPDLGIEKTVYSVSGWRDEITKFKDYWTERIPSVQQHIQDTLGVSGMFTLTLNNPNKVQGTVEINRNRKEISDQYIAEHFSGIPMSIYAKPAPGFKFVKWLETGNDNSNIVITANSDTTLTPVFEIDEVDLSEYDGLIISEINYNPGLTGLMDQEQLEFIEFTNVSNSSIDISGLLIGGAFTTYEIPAGMTLSPGGAFILSRNPEVFKNFYGSDPLFNVLGPWLDGKLSNKGETITVSARNRELLFSVSYSDKFPWPAEADGDGKSLKFIQSNYSINAPETKSDIQSSSVNWSVSEENFGNPGSVASSGTTTNKIIVDGDISEWASQNVRGEDPADVDSVDNPIDLLTASFKHLDNHYYFGLTNDGPIELNYGWAFFLNSGANNTTFNLAEFQTDYLVQNDNLFRYSGDGSAWEWSHVADIEIVSINQMVELCIPDNLIPETGNWKFAFVGDNGAFGGTIIDHAPERDGQGNHWVIKFNPNSSELFTPNPDGDISDWPSFTKTFTREQVNHPSGSLKSFHIAYDGENAFLGTSYFGEHSSSIQNSYCFDIDMSPDTGYQIGTIGADVLIQGLGVFSYIPEDTRTGGRSWEYIGQLQEFSTTASKEIIIPWKYFGRIDNAMLIITESSNQYVTVSPLQIDFDLGANDVRPNRMTRSQVGSQTLKRIPLEEDHTDIPATDISLSTQAEIYVRIPESGQYTLESTDDLQLWLLEFSGSGTPGSTHKFDLDRAQKSNLLIRRVAQ